MQVQVIISCSSLGTIICLGISLHCIYCNWYYKHSKRLLVVTFWRHEVIDSRLELLMSVPLDATELKTGEFSWISPLKLKIRQKFMHETMSKLFIKRNMLVQSFIFMFGREIRRFSGALASVVSMCHSSPWMIIREVRGLLYQEKGFNSIWLTCSTVQFKS